MSSDDYPATQGAYAFVAWMILGAIMDFILFSGIAMARGGTSYLTHYGWGAIVYVILVFPFALFAAYARQQAAKKERDVYGDDS